MSPSSRVVKGWAMEDRECPRLTFLPILLTVSSSSLFKVKGERVGATGRRVVTGLRHAVENVSVWFSIITILPGVSPPHRSAVRKA